MHMGLWFAFTGFAKASQCRAHVLCSRLHAQPGVGRKRSFFMVAMGQFFGAHLRFFRQLCTAAKVQSGVWGQGVSWVGDDRGQGQQALGDGSKFRLHLGGHGMALKS